MHGNSLPPPLARARRAVLRVLAATSVLLVVETASAEPAAVTRAPTECTDRYHAALVAIGKSDYAKAKAARAIAFKGDDNLPGVPIFATQPHPRSAQEMAALREAVALARGRGRAAWLASTDKRWIADRVLTELGEYLTQDTSPYLCGGVADYLATVRAYTRRIISAPAEPAGHVGIQREAARRAIRRALAAMQPVPKPRFAASPRGTTLLAELRPSKDADRAAAFLTPAVHSSRKRVYGPMIDPDLPPLAMSTVMPLATGGDRLAVLHDLVGAARAGGFMAMAESTRTVSGNADAGTPTRPVLAELARLKPLLVGQKNAVDDPLVRRALVTAFAEIEALDYLAARPAGGDPMLAAIQATLDAIEAAHAKACDCAD